MLPSYNDIRSRIPDEPTWYDDAAALIEIECQQCAWRCLVGIGSSTMGRARSAWLTAYLAGDGRDPEYEDADAWLRSISEDYHYGDPPRHGCGGGDTMNCIDIRLVQAWRKNPDWRDFEHPYVRAPELERDYELPEWAK